MASHHQLHPELHAFVDSLLPGDVDETTLEQAREELAAMTAMVPSEHPGCEVTRARSRSHDGHDVPLVVVRPLAALPSGVGRPAICWTHGGGYLAGHAEAETPFLAWRATELNMVGVSVDYRLAPEHPHPAPVEDAFAALRWMHDHAAELGVDPGRIAAADDASHRRGVGEVLWSPSAHRFAWRSLLGDVAPGSADVSPYASPARAEDLGGLPPTFIDVGDLDLFAVECITYAERLLGSGVPTDLHVVSGAPHGYIYAGEDLALCRAHRERVLAFLAKT